MEKELSQYATELADCFEAVIEVDEIALRTNPPSASHGYSSILNQRDLPDDLRDKVAGLKDRINDGIRAAEELENMFVSSVTKVLNKHPEATSVGLILKVDLPMRNRTTFNESFDESEEGTDLIFDMYNKRTTLHVPSLIVDVKYINDGYEIKDPLANTEALKNG